MPITATFVADFKSFYDAVQQSTVKLKDFQSNAEAVAQKVDKVANAFSGRKLVQDAEIMTKAITEIGGATALTAKEQAQVNAKLTEAIEKYKALGQVAPQAMKDLEVATRQVDDQSKKASFSIKDIGGSLLKMASAIGIAFSVEAAVGFVKSVFDAAERVQDLSEKLGISTTAVQRFSYAAEQSGASIDDVGNAIFKMNQKLADGSKETANALKDLGLSLDAVRQMSPEQAFIAITDALQKIENPAMRARLEIELLGKAGGALGAAISAGLNKMGDAAKIMSDDTIRRLADAKQAWENLANRVTVITGEMIANVLKFRGSAAIVERAALGEGAPVPGGRGGKDVTLPAGVTAGAGELERLAREREAALRKAQAAADQQRAADEKIFQGMRQFSAELEKRDTNMARSLQGIQAFVVAHRQAAEVISATIPAEVSRQWEDWGKRVDDNAKSLQTWGKIAGDQYNRVAADAKKFFQSLPPAVDEFKRLNDEMQKLAAITGSKVIDTIARVTNGLQGLREATTEAVGGAKDLATGFARLASGDIIGGLASVTSGLFQVIDAAKKAWAALKSVFGFGSGGRDAVVAFAESLGGFDVLQKQLEALGAEGERLWIKLTQGTDRGNAEQAKKNIEEVEEALRKHKEAAGDVTEATEEQARATIETASEAERAMKALEPLLKANEDQWRAWGDVVNSQIDRVASALRSLALPNLSGDALQPPAPAGGGGTAVINLDGRQIAEAVVPRIPGVVKRYGLA